MRACSTLFVKLGVLTGRAVCLLGLAACLRFGYEEHRIRAADGADAGRPDAAAPFDASKPSDAAAATDASAPSDASKPSDAAAATDAATATDASKPSDAAAATDASAPSDAAAATDAAPSCGSTVSRDYCLQLPALPQAPQLDGVLDCGPSLIDLPPTGWKSSQALPSDNHARYAAAWRPDGLYFYVEVDDMLRLPALASDVNPWCGDGVELFADSDGQYDSAPGYDNPGTIQLLATAPARDPSTPLAVDARYHTRSQLRVGDWAATRHVMVPRDDGYALEAFVAAADLGLSSWRLASGGTVGIDISINVSVADETQEVNCGYSLGQYYLRLSRLPCAADSCRPYSNVEAFCTPRLD